MLGHILNTSHSTTEVSAAAYPTCQRSYADVQVQPDISCVCIAKCEKRTELKWDICLDAEDI